MLHKLILAALVLTSTIATGCNDTDTPGHPQDDEGKLSLRFEAGDVDIDTIAYAITHATRPALNGVFDVSDPATASFERAGIPVDTGYTLSLKADTVDGLQTCTGTSALFDIHPGLATSLVVDLNCVDKELPDTDTTSTDTDSTSTDSTETVTEGSLDADIKVNECARVRGLAASPNGAPVGTSIELTANISDTNTAALAYLWQVDGVTISTVETASYVCEVVGEHEVSLTVQDGTCDPVIKTLTATCSSAAVATR